MPFMGATIRASYFVLRVHLRWNLNILLTLLEYDLIISYGQERGRWQQQARAAIARAT